MAGVFDRLQKQIDNKQSAGGITALDLADLPPALRKIMRLMLREVQLDRSHLGEAMQALPADDQLSPADLESALDTLTTEFWLTRLGEGERAIYKVNLRRKGGSTLSAGIWSSLDSKLKDG